MRPAVGSSRRYRLIRLNALDAGAVGLLPGDGQLRAAVGLVAGLVWREHVAARPVVSRLGLGGMAAVVSLWGITVEDDFRSEGLCQMVMFSEFTCDSVTMPQCRYSSDRISLPDLSFCGLQLAVAAMRALPFWEQYPLLA